MKFGVYLPQGMGDLTSIPDPIEKYETLTRCAREAERSGFDSIWLEDHFHTVPCPRDEAVFECWTTMAALARDTSTIRLGQMVTCNGYRPPALLAKMSSCVDVMSHGRLIVGIGAGWYQDEYDAYGYDFGDIADRLDRLDEAAQILKAMWTQDRATFEGRHYRVRDAINLPKPVQKPHPPLWIGGEGEQVTLRLVARHADGCNVGGGDPGVIRHKLEVLRRHCAELGRDYDAIARSTGVTISLGAPSGPDDRYAGTTPEIAERLRELIDLGIDHLVLIVPTAAEEGTIERLGSELLPLLR